MVEGGRKSAAKVGCSSLVMALRVTIDGTGCDRASDVELLAALERPKVHTYL